MAYDLEGNIFLRNIVETAWQLSDIQSLNHKWY